MATKAIIVAAGRGSRLGPKTQDVPKPLLQVGPKRLIEHQLEMLAEAGIGPVGMVLGYQADEIMDIVGTQCEYIINHKWSTSNSLFSFLQAEQWIGDDDFILMNCDILLHPKILDRLIEQGPDCFAYDSSSGDGREQMKVQLNNQRLVSMSKTMDESLSQGENVGMLYFSNATGQKLFKTGQELIENGHMTSWVGSAVQQVAAQTEITGVDIEGLPWAEIDFAYDLVRARKEVWPAIRKRKKPKLVLPLIFGSLLLLTFYFAVKSFSPGAEPLKGKDWDTIKLEGLEQVRLENGDKRQKWYVLEMGDTAKIQTYGPDTLRVEIRTLPQNEAFRKALFNVFVDGELVEWIISDPKASNGVTLLNNSVSKRERLEIPLPAGAHSLEVVVNQDNDVKGLLRIREVSDELELGD